MPYEEPPFSLGLEEEYLLVDQDTLALTAAPQALMEACSEELQGKFSPEFLLCQVEVGTGICANIAEAREDLGNLRRVVARCTNEFGLAPIAASCHPFSDWKDQKHTDKERYKNLQRDLGGVARRMLICGGHVHVGIPDEETRIDLMRQFTYFLPHLLALSTSSPYWQGDDTGLSSYRLTVFDNLPRTGLPPHFDSWSDYQRSVNTIVSLGLIEDSSKIWWDLRPSSKFPTVETRICDVSPRLETTLTLAALIQSISRLLWRLKTQNQRWRAYDNFLVSENRWRAQRYGASGSLIDFGQGKLVPVAELIDEIIELVTEDAQVLGCLAEVQNARTIAQTGTSSDRQRATFAKAIEDGADKHEALKAVVRHLIDEYHTDL